MTRPWETLASVDTRDGKLELLRRSERDFLITIRGRVLMTSAAHRSEDELAKLGCAGLRTQKRARVLLSGLGMGYTLRAALSELAGDALVWVSELNPVVVEWCRGPLGELTQDAARDRRVELAVEDVAARVAQVALDSKQPRFHAIVLDMYEGPAGRPKASDPLYGERAVLAYRTALVPEGKLAVWCEQASPGFERALHHAGFRYELVRTGHGGRVHYVYVATAPSEWRLRVDAQRAAERAAQGPRPAGPHRMRSGASKGGGGKSSGGGKSGGGGKGGGAGRSGGASKGPGRKRS